MNAGQSELGILIAMLGGLAVGLEREWSSHATGRSRFAGVRTFTLMGLLSGMSGWLWTSHLEAIAAILIAGASALVVVAYARSSHQWVDGTTEVASLVVLAAGLAAGIGFWALAGASIAITALLLVEKSRIHDLAYRLDDVGLRAAVRFGVMAIVILPLLPEGPFGPGPGFRPRMLWIAVLLFTGLSFAGYIARRALSGTTGYPIAGLLGGLMSSTAVTLTFSRLSRAESGHDKSLAVGVIGASTVLFIRVIAATVTLNPQLAYAALPYLAAPFAAGLVGTAIIWWLNRKPPEKTQEITNPLQFWNSLQMAVLFQVVLYLVHWLNDVFGARGLLISGATLGLMDVDAVILSMARGIHSEDWTVPAQALSLGILSNTALKAAIAFSLGKGRFRTLATAGLAGIGVVLLLMLGVLG